MNRRTFIASAMGTSAAAALSARNAWSDPFPARQNRRIARPGLELYTVRGLMKDDFEGTLAKVAAVGYKEVEFAGYFDHSPKQVRAAIDKHGLTSPSCHISYDVVEKHLPEAIESAKIIGQSYLICPWIDESQRKDAGGWKRAAELFNRAGETCRKSGITFGYHNHNFEFAPDAALGGKMPYDFLLAETDAHLVKMEMDLGWIHVGGQDPLKYFKEYPGRFPLVHVKDFKKDGTMENVGQGEIDWKRIFEHSGEAGIKHYFVENDNAAKPLDDIRVSYEYLAALRF
jgi:sugar phosphate isomerase/epimerase